MTKNNLLTVAIRKAMVCAIAPTVAVVALSANAQDDVTAMETITVTAQALKVETPAAETPRSVSIISEDELRVRAPQKLDEALRYTSGVTAQPYGADNDTDWFKVRGFDAATYLNGNRLFRDGYYTWLVEPYGLESVEVVKGPSAILFGESAPGGIVNAVQKKPTFTPQGEVKVEVGNNQHQSVGFDIADEANDDGTIRYRLVGLMTSQDGELDGTNNERFYLAPSVEFDISDRTMLTVLATYLRDDGVPTNPFFPAAGTLIGSNFGKIDPSTNLGQPNYDKYERTQFSLGYLLEHDINDTWSFSQNLNYGSNELYLRSSYAFSNNDPAKEELTQGIVFRDGKNQSITFDNNAVGNWMTDNAEHTVLVGMDLQFHKTDGDEQDNYAFGTINLAWFDITQKNALVTNPSTWIATQTGEVTSQGIELESTAQLTDDLKLMASYTYTKAKTDESFGKGKKQAALIPEHQASAWVDYSAYSLIPGLNIGTGVRYVGESKDNPKSSNLTVPSVTLWDASVTYDITSQWQAQLNVNNILDKEFVSGCDYWCYYGQSRSVMLNANYRW
ncbi:TPA: TonB-dependent siderophore receptor [Vibrio parahaemolyticus]